jgi:hypothetical protein
MIGGRRGAHGGEGLMVKNLGAELVACWRNWIGLSKPPESAQDFYNVEEILGFRVRVSGRLNKFLSKKYKKNL